MDDLIDKQSVPNARNHFSEKVEAWMRKHGYEQAADLTQIIREWYDAEDTPGMPAHVRVKYWLNMRNLLLDGTSFSTFPPDFRYIKGVPIITFEGMVMGIDTKLQMYSIAGPYNVRTVGSLSAETCVGILQDMNPSGAVSVKAADVPQIMSTVAEVMTYKMDPER